MTQLAGSGPDKSDIITMLPNMTIPLLVEVCVCWGEGGGGDITPEEK